METEECLFCYVYVPNVYNGGGTTQTLVWIVEHFAHAGIQPILCFERTWQFPAKVRSISLFPSFLRWLPGRWTKIVRKSILERAFLKRLSARSPTNTFVYIWPQPRLELIKAVKLRGFCVFREMINCPAKVCASEVGKARRNAELASPEAITDSEIAQELLHLEWSDFVTAPNAEVERALRAIGMARSKILATSFGWAQDRFPNSLQRPAREGRSNRVEGHPVTILFVGLIGFRKGVHYLLEAWNDMPPSMRLQLVGTVEAEIQPLLDRAMRDEQIIHVPFSAELEPIFRSADVFVFPTVEEGGPQVTLEAAGCGLPVITTPMGSGRLIADGRNGLIIPPHDVPALRAAMLDLFRHPPKCDLLARQAELDAQAFTYDKVGASRAALFRRRFSEFVKASRMQSR